MKDLGDRMRAIAEDPPPTTIDVDRVIASERRRTRNIRVVTAVACSVAAVVLSTTLIPGVRAGLIPVDDTEVGSQQSAPPVVTEQPAASPEDPSAVEATPWESQLACGTVTRSPTGAYQSFDAANQESFQPTVTASRLSTVVAKALAKTSLSKSKLRDLQHDDRCGGMQFVYDSQRRTFRLGLEVVDPMGIGTLVISLRPLPARSEPDPCATSRSCNVMTNADGSTYIADTLRTESGGLQYSMSLSRTDGTLVLVSASNQAGGSTPLDQPTRKIPPLDLDDLVALSQNPGLTLYP